MKIPDDFILSYQDSLIEISRNVMNGYVHVPSFMKDVVKSSSTFSELPWEHTGASKKSLNDARWEILSQRLRIRQLLHTPGTGQDRRGDRACLY